MKGKKNGRGFKIDYLQTQKIKNLDQYFLPAMRNKTEQKKKKATAKILEQ